MESNRNPLPAPRQRFRSKIPVYENLRSKSPQERSLKKLASPAVPIPRPRTSVRRRNPRSCPGENSPSPRGPTTASLPGGIFILEQQLPERRPEELASQGKHGDSDRGTKTCSLKRQYKKGSLSKLEQRFSFMRKNHVHPPSPTIRPRSMINMTENDPNIPEEGEERAESEIGDLHQVLNNVVVGEMSMETWNRPGEGEEEETPRKQKKKLKKIKPLFKNPFRTIPRSFKKLQKMQKVTSNYSSPNLSDTAKEGLIYEGSDSGFDVDSSLCARLSSKSSSIMSDIEEIGSVQEMQTMSLPNTSRLRHKKLKGTIEFASSEETIPGLDNPVDEILVLPDHVIKPKAFKNAIDKDYHFKVLVIGDPGVGKTSFVQRYTSNSFRPDYRGTVGVDFAMKVLDLPGNIRVRLQMWDIAGQERYTWMSRVYYKESSGCIIMLDLTSKKSLESVRKWKNDLDSKVTSDDGVTLPTLLLANKCDLTQRAVTTAEVESLFSSGNYLGWCEVSAKQDIMVADAVRFLVDTMIERDEKSGKPQNKEENLVIIEEDPEPDEVTPKRLGCC